MEMLYVDPSVITGVGAAIYLVISFFVAAVYFLPSIIAIITKNNRRKVVLFNIFLGWTVVMWIISLVWAFKKAPQLNYNYPPQDTQPINK